MRAIASNSTGCRLTSDVIIGIPACNEADTVGDVVRAARAPVVDVLVVDDGSEDRTAAVAAEAGATVVQHDENRGYAAALGTLFTTAHETAVDHLVVIGADGQYDPTDTLDPTDVQRSSGADIVLGSRFVHGAETDMPLYRRAGLCVINGLTGTALGLGYSSKRVANTQSGFRAYNADAIERFACRVDLIDGVDASHDVLLHAADKNFSFTETPVDVTYDVAEANTRPRHRPRLQHLRSRSLGPTGTGAWRSGLDLSGDRRVAHPRLDQRADLAIDVLPSAGYGTVADRQRAGRGRPGLRPIGTA